MLIPIFLIILYWGNNWERLEASFYLLIYIMFISLLMLIYIMILSINNCNLDINLIVYFNNEILFTSGK